MATVDPCIVEYHGGGGAHKCGYCGNNGSCSHGLWAHSLTVQDYQDLIDRGWRRSGKYCYKPTMNKTCCPNYTIKMEALNFKMNKSHKKILKQMNKYLIHGTVKGEPAKSSETKPKPEVSGAAKPTEDSTSGNITDATPGHAPKAPPRPGSGADPNKPQMRKAKDIRLERKQSRNLIKLQSMTEEEAKAAQELVKGLDREASTMSTMSICSSKNEAKTLADYLSEPDKAEKCVHKLEIRLVKSNPRSKEFEESFKESHQVYHKYQMGIHHDPPHKPNESQYTRFLCDSPLQIRLVRTAPQSNEFKSSDKESAEVFKKYQMKVHKDQPYECDRDQWLNFLVHSPLKEETKKGGLPQGYGSFHQHYILDGKIIAVGVIDILPYCVSSVYLYYHPDYDFLSLGTYTALREIAFVQELNKKAPDLIYYYMGYYIHSCPKMKYKGQYFPSFLLCPETYTWLPIAECAPKLDVNKYSRFAADDVEDDGAKLEIDTVLVLFCRQIMTYEIYKALNAKARDAKEVMEYALFVGRKCAQRLLLFRKS
ncbi:Arginyl-tRNA--protein transferase 1 [Mizuhopecten yessoensis]|uniref:Arginyl-tRNA--protein transferase 1 n=1 Tax=Mizuhopecten yessoensis TaxID=6573 RepID=A0A210QJN5_MIZYE|nr:Arginyl-tRNA--protein transferase 1 [Mizuhopecten yessoensis]